MKLLARIGAVAAGLAVGFVGVVGFLHTPYGRPFMHRLGMACPARKVTPAQVEAVRLRAVAALRGDLRSPARPALGQNLDVSRAAEVTTWTRAHDLSCVEKARPIHTITCAGAAGTIARDPKAPPLDQIVFAFAPDGRLVSVDRLRSTLTPGEATRLFGEAADRLLAALGPGQVVGDASPDYLGSGSMHAARLAYRFSDYLATVTTMNVAGRIVLHEQYESARGG
jgi:hypothetical protein